MSLTVIPWDGKKIDRPGIFSGIPISEYHGDICVGPSISSSGLRTIFDPSPAHYFAVSYLNPDREEPKDSEAFVLGRGAHHLLLGEANFADHFAIRPEELNGAAWQGNRKDCREWLKMCRDQGLTVLLPAQIKAIRGMARGLNEHPMVRAGILNGLIEHSMIWQDKETGVWVKARPDAIPTSDADYSDLKTAADVTDLGIERAIGDRGYHVQGAVIGLGSREVIGRPMESFTLVFAEKTAPHCARVKTIKPVDIELGEKQVRAGLRLFAKCLDTSKWPGPGGEQSDAEFVEIKPWARTEIEFRLARIEQELEAA